MDSIMTSVQTDPNLFVPKDAQPWSRADEKSTVQHIETLACNEPRLLPAFDDLPLRAGDPKYSAWGLWGVDDQAGTLVSPASLVEFKASNSVPSELLDSKDYAKGSSRDKRRPKVQSEVCYDSRCIYTSTQCPVSS
jgi:hypothetical protein